LQAKRARRVAPKARRKSKMNWPHRVCVRGRGRMKMNVRHSTVRASFAVLAVLTGSWSLSPTAYAQESVERVEITGSSIKRIEGETSLPVQVITRKELEQSGAT